MILLFYFQVFSPAASLQTPPALCDSRAAHFNVNVLMRRITATRAIFGSVKNPLIQTTSLLVIHVCLQRMETNLCEATEGKSSGLTVSFFLPSVEELRPHTVWGVVTLHWRNKGPGISNSHVNTEGTILIYDIVTVCINHVHTEPPFSACNSSIIRTAGLGVWIQFIQLTGRQLSPNDHLT